MYWRLFFVLAVVAAGVALGSDAQTTTTYDYDALGRLKSAVSSNGVSTAYSYDPGGNRTSAQAVGGAPSSEQGCRVVVVPLSGFTVIPTEVCQ